MRKTIIIVLSILTINAFSQVVTENTKRKFTIGLDVFTDMWQDIPKTLELSTINPGVNVFGSYNVMLGESDFSFSPGIGIGVHNLFNSSFIVSNNDSSYFVPVADSVSGLSYKRSKLTMPYFDIPLELRFKSKGEFRVAVGFKFGFLIRSYSKYKGDDFLSGLSNTVIYKKKKIQNLEKNRYGFTARLGYKWLNLWGYYQLSSLFENGKGSSMYPVSIGISIIPF